MARKKADADLGKEVKALVGHIGEALKAAKNSEEMKQIQRDAAASLRAAGSRIAATVDKARRSDSVKKIRTQAGKVIEMGKTRGKPTMENVGKNLSDGLRFVSRELDALADRLKKK